MDAIIYIAIGCGLCASVFMLLLMIALCQVAGAADAWTEDNRNDNQLH